MTRRIVLPLLAVMGVGLAITAIMLGDRTPEGATTVVNSVVPGNPDLRMRLQFERIEPYAVPKVSLTGESTERTDTRVLQVIYSFERGELPIYIGQRMNVHIEGPAAADAGAQSANSIASRPGKGAR